MAFKLPNQPSTKAGVCDLADFLEIMTLLMHSVSSSRLHRLLNQASDDIFNEGIEDEDVENEGRVLDVFQEIDRRKRCSDGFYPFELTQQGHQLSLVDEEKVDGRLYKFLLLATRLNMDSSSIRNDIDAREKFEFICANVLRAYLGGLHKSLSTNSRVGASVFGTAQAGGFKDKVNQLIAQIGEGDMFRERNGQLVAKNDDKLDVVGWIDLPDKLHSKISVFGQCKTGTNWTSGLYELNPDDFIHLWFASPIIIPPIKAFFIADSVGLAQRLEIASKAKLLFDRTRIASYCWSVDDALLESASEWVAAHLEDLRKIGYYPATAVA